MKLVPVEILLICFCSQQSGKNVICVMPKTRRLIQNVKLRNVEGKPQKAKYNSSQRQNIRHWNLKQESRGHDFCLCVQKHFGLSFRIDKKVDLHKKLS